MRRVYLDSHFQEGIAVTIFEEKRHHLINILKLGLNDPVHLFNGREEWLCKIIQVNKKNLLIVPVEFIRNEELFFHNKLMLFCPVIKKDVFHLIFRQAVENGVTEIYPYTSSRSSAATGQIYYEKLIKIAIEALEQCNGMTLPLIHKTLNFRQILSLEFLTLYGDEKSGRESSSSPLNQSIPYVSINYLKNIQANKFFGDQTADQETVKAANQTAILLGPEGGFSNEEIELLRAKKNFMAINLGTRILRCETAAVSLIQCAKLISNFIDN